MEASCLNSLAEMSDEVFHMIELSTVCLDVPAERHSLSESSMRVLLTHVDAWLCILSSPLHSWASCCRDVYP